jgi:hypothetical protein
MQTKKEILNILIEKIQSANEKLKMNFHQDEVKLEIDKIKEKYKNNNNKFDYSIKEGQIEYKSNYKNIFPESVKYGILSNIRNSTDERIDVVENIIGKIKDSLENIKSNLKNKKLNDKIEIKKDNSIVSSSLETDILTIAEKKQKNKINFNIVGKNFINILNQNEKDFDFEEKM